jgi:hypothetical protein
MKSVNNLSFKNENLLKLRTFFLHKVLGASTLKEYSIALRALSTLKDYPFVKTDEA